MPSNAGTADWNRLALSVHQDRYLHAFGSRVKLAKTY